MDATLTLLGQFSVTADGQPVPMDTRSARLLAALAIKSEDGPIVREELSRLLWPNACRDRALANVRAVLWRMGHDGRTLVTRRNREVALHPDVEVDIHALCLSRRPQGVATSDIGFHFTLDQLSAPLLTGWYDEWVIEERDRVRGCQLALLEQRVRAHLESGDASAAVIEATWAVTIDPLNESAHQLLLRSHLAEGNVNEAVSHFRHLKRLLNRELGVPPFPDTSKIIEPCLR